VLLLISMGRTDQDLRASNFANMVEKANEIKQANHRLARAERASMKPASEHHAKDKSLQQRVSRAVRRNSDVARLAGCFTVLNKTILGERQDLRWAVLDPAVATLTLWDEPPEEDCASLEAQKLIRSSRLSKTSGNSRTPKTPLKTFDLEEIRNVDCNPHSWNIFMNFSGGASCCLTAPDQRVFSMWMTALNGYDVFDFDATQSRPKLKSLPVFKDLFHLGW
jgi:hypothetical protein